MTRRNTFLITVLALLFIQSSCVSFFGSNGARKKAETYGFQNFTTYYIRDSPITVREYLIFLAWNIDVYGDSYPEYVSGLFPGNCSSIIDTIENNYDEFFVCAKFNFPRYTFTGMSIDYPVSGLTTYQLKELYKWFTDRYNENMLIEIGYLKYNPNQKDEDSYSLEADLCNLFQGDIEDDNKRPSWIDGLYVPLLRPPSIEESFPTRQVLYENKISSIWREYKLTKAHFLYKWDQLYIKEDSKGIKLNTEPPIGLAKGYSNMRSNDQINSFYLDSLSTHFEYCTHLEEQDLKKKNEYGRMSFYVLGETGFNRPIVTDSIVYSSEINPKNCIYWIVYNGRIDSKYWP